VKFFVNPISKSGYVVICDNGSGMDRNDLKEFATVSLDQESRNKELEVGRSMISKFGVGAKHAGFFLGTSISVISKTREADTIYEFSMDKAAFESRSAAGQNVSR